MRCAEPRVGCVASRAGPAQLWKRSVFARVSLHWMLPEGRIRSMGRRGWKLMPVFLDWRIGLLFLARAIIVRCR